MTDKAESFDFVLDFQQVPVTIRDPKTGQVTEYILRELDGLERDRYINSMKKRVTVAGKSATVTDFEGMQATLLSLTLCRVDTGKGESVETIQRWPARIQNALFIKATEISGLERSSAAEAKND